ncbi:hypothetical protein [Dyadobacter sp. 32]|uniref:hypothetical protein n=1 Tax=Dyadobacter sp. 32 TaxID=538966 RepID=UPI0011EE5B42
MNKKDLNGGELVLKISSLWHEQKRREILYLLALQKDKMGSLRKMLTQGHFSAILFQKEIKTVYDYFKCLLNDKELDDRLVINELRENSLRGMEEKEQVMGYLSKMESGMLNSYRSLHTYLDRDSETRRMIDAHLIRITEFYEILSSQEAVNNDRLRAV